MALAVYAVGVTLVCVALAIRLRRMRESYEKRLDALREARAGIDETLKFQAHRFDALLDAMSEAVFRLDAEGKVLAANARARQVFRLDGVDVQGRPMIFFYRDPDWLETFAQHLRRLPEPGRLANMQVGKWVLAPRLAPLGSNQALLLCMDVTDQVRLEQQRRTFLANLMHDLKTPLTSLLGYARSLETFGHDEAFRRDAAKVIADEAKHVNRLLDALLTLDQIEFAQHLESAQCCLSDVLRKVRAGLQPRLKAKRLSWEGSDEDELSLDVAMAEEDVGRILTNVFDNAVRYAPQGSKIHVSHETGDGMLTLTVEDEGPGVPEEALPRLTERFFRVHKARSRKEGGHGLGLAIVKEMLEAHGGEVRLSNRPPHGLCVRMRLPLANKNGASH